MPGRTLFLRDDQLTVLNRKLATKSGSLSFSRFWVRQLLLKRFTDKRHGMRIAYLEARQVESCIAVLAA